MPSFRTSHGRCILDEDNLYISSSSIGLLKRYLEGGIVGKLVISSFFSFPVIILTTMSTTNFQPFLNGFLIGLGLGLTFLVASFVINYFRDFSYDHLISRDSINEVKVVDGVKGVSQPRFIVSFQKNRETRNRYIKMPSKLLDYGEEEFEKAQEILKDEGFKLEK